MKSPRFTLDFCEQTRAITKFIQSVFSMTDNRIKNSLILYMYIYIHHHRLVFLQRSLLLGKYVHSNYIYYITFSFSFHNCLVYLKVHSHPRHKLYINFASPNYKFRLFNIRTIFTLIIFWKQHKISTHKAVELP